jgi:hypothetical protein
VSDLSVPAYCVFIERADRLVPGQALVLFHQLLPGFNVVGIMRNTVYGADLDTLGCFVVTNAFSTQIGINLVDLIAGTDGLVWALRFTHIAIDTFISNI